MDRETAKRIVSTEDGRKLMLFIAEKIDELNQVSDIPATTTEMVATTTIGRQEAIKSLKAMLHPLLEARQPEPELAPRDEYVV